MNTYRFTIRLTSDAEPGTGLGGETINELVPRDHRGRPTIRASHVKGLMRQQLRDVIRNLSWPPDVETWIFGGEGLDEDAAQLGAEAPFHLADALMVNDQQPGSATGLVTRTAVDDSTGVAGDATLRTTERVAIGTAFQGQVHTDLPANSPADLAWRLALSSIAAVGGNRNRGCGDCVVLLEGETRSPGKLLGELNRALAQPDWKQSLATRLTGTVPLPNEQVTSGSTVTLRLVFLATTPICCPENPNKANVVSTGFSIPASAVQGAILNRLNRLDPSLATATYGDSAFRAWPLHPAGLPDGELEQNGGMAETDEGSASWRSQLANVSERLPTSIRVSLTHRMAKFSIGGQGEEFESRHFFDEAIDVPPYDWRRIADGAPLKAADGVLLADGDQIQLWRASLLPHVLSSHGVHGGSPDERNLFSMDAIAPLIWEGLAVLPAKAAELLQQSLRDNPIVALGKSRSVRGLGLLRATVEENLPVHWQLNGRTEYPVLVAQSPLQLPDSSEGYATAEQEFFALVQGWTRRHGLPEPHRVWPNLGLRFGWNRHASGLQRACRVALPGSVIAFGHTVDQTELAKALAAGVGPGRERGFGAVSVHPGKATSAKKAVPKIPSRTGKQNALGAMQLVMRLRESGERLPSPSQIRAVQQRLQDGGADAALVYLRQRAERAPRIWFAWEAIYDDMERLLRDYEPHGVAFDALELLADLAIHDAKEERR